MEVGRQRGVSDSTPEGENRVKDPRGREQGEGPRDWASLGPEAAKGVRDRAVRGGGH